MRYVGLIALVSLMVAGVTAAQEGGASRPAASRLLQHPLDPKDGGDPFHAGGKHWSAQDPEYRTLASWVKGETGPLTRTAARVIQTNSAGDSAHVIDPATQKVIGEIHDVPIAHGVVGAPDGTRLYISDEARHTLDVIDTRTLSRAKTVPVAGEVGRVFVGQHPEWLTFTPDGRYAYVAAAGDNLTYVIDAKTLKEVARIPVGQVPKRIATAVMQVY